LRARHRPEARPRAAREDHRMDRRLALRRHQISPCETVIGGDVAVDGGDRAVGVAGSGKIAVAWSAPRDIES